MASALISKELYKQPFDVLSLLTFLRRACCGLTWRDMAAPHPVQRAIQKRRAHTEEKPLKCDVEGCGARFASKQHLKNHKLTHTKEKPFKCDFEGCGIRFGLMHNLVKHQKRLHTGRKQFKCKFLIATHALLTKAAGASTGAPTLGKSLISAKFVAWPSHDVEA